MQVKSCFVTLNRITGFPVTAPNQHGQAGLFNPGNLVFAVGNSNPGLEPGMGLKGLRRPEGGVYKSDEMGNIFLSSQFPLLSLPKTKGQWPVNNWTSALLDSSLQDGVYKTSASQTKDENFQKLEAEKVIGFLSPCEFDMPPQLGWLHTTDDGAEGAKKVSMKANRFAALLRSRFFELAAPIRYGQDEQKKADVQNLITKFRNLFIALQEGVDDKICCAYTVQFSEAIEGVGITNYEGLMNCLNVLNGAKDQVELALVAGTFGEKPTTSGWITPVIQSSPVWVWNHSSKLIEDDKGFFKAVSQAQLGEVFGAATE